jgi:hypothetical protein
MAPEKCTCGLLPVIILNLVAAYKYEVELSTLLVFVLDSGLLANESVDVGRAECAT